jgi:hypothetical protein
MSRYGFAAPISVKGRYYVAMKIPKLAATSALQTLSGLSHYIDRSLNYRVAPSGQGDILNGPAINLLAQLDRLVWLSLETTLMPFLIKSTMGWKRFAERDAYGHQLTVTRRADTRTAVPNSVSGGSRALAECLTSVLSSAARFDPSDPATKQLQHAPHLEVLLEIFFDHSIRNCLGRGINALDVNTGLIRAELYNDFVVRFRQAMLDRKLLRRERHNWGLGSLENVEQLHAYLDDLFTKHRSLTVLHLRLFHATERANLLSTSVEDQHRDLHALRACRTVFLDRMRKKPALFTDEPKCVWAIQPSLEGGYDLHLTLLFDTTALQKVLDDKRVEAEQNGEAFLDHADQVGAYWVRGATGGRGSYLRGDRNAWLYGSDWVHGEVRSDEYGRREKLKETLGYLAMRRALVRLKNEPPGQYFGMPERKARRPRRSVKGARKAG